MNMMRSLFGGNGFGGPLGNIMNIFQKFQQFVQNPFAALMSLGNVNIPQNLSNNPEAMVNYLRNSGQMTSDQFDQCNQLTQQFQNIMPKKS